MKLFNRIRAGALSVILTASVFLTASCSKDTASSATDITLTGNTVVTESSAVYVDDTGRVSITSAGAYRLSGELEDGQIWVDCVDAGVCTLILDNVNIYNADGPCIVFKNAQQAEIILATGSSNTLTDGEDYVFEKPDDDEPDAVVFSKEDLKIAGEGSLTVNANFAGGIYSKDGLLIASGNISITSARHGIKGKDYLRILDGNIDIHAEGDGIKSTNYENETLGYIEIDGGTINIFSEDEAVQAVSEINFNGGEVTLQSTNNGIKCAGEVNFNGGTVTIDAQDVALNAAEIEKKDACTVTVAGLPYEG